MRTVLGAKRTARRPLIRSFSLMSTPRDRVLRLVGGRGRRGSLAIRHKGVAPPAPLLKTVEQAGLGLDRLDRRLDVVPLEQRARRTGEEETDRLAGVEMNPEMGRPGGKNASFFMVKVNGDQSVSHTGQRIDAILWLVR